MEPSASPPRLFVRDAWRTNSRLRLKGVRRAPFADIYYFLMRASWPLTLAILGGVFLGTNALFGLAYRAVGGVENARPGSFADAFFFSVQTLGTIGYGRMSPVGLAAQCLVSLETMTGLLGLATVTGLVYAKFSRPTARVVFSDVALIATRDGRPTFMFRVGNERASHIMEAILRVTLLRSTRTQEGEPLRKMEDLTLVRSQSPAFVLTWTALHVIDESSPLHGATPASLAQMAAEIVITLTGIDATLSQAIHSRHSYVASEIRFGHRFEDVLTSGPGGVRDVDLTRFHRTFPVPEDPLARLDLAPAAEAAPASPS